MTRMGSRCAILPWLFALWGCPRLEPRDVKQDAAEVGDGSIDAGMQDGGVHCQFSGCAGQAYCDPADGMCKALPTECDDTSDCRGGQACLLSMKKCGDPPKSCKLGCSVPERCTGAGYCARPWTEDGTFRPTCGESSDCGPGGICSNGACVECGPRIPCDPGRKLTCSAGRCVEPAACTVPGDCFAGNECVTASATCKRSESNCTVDPENNTRDKATRLIAGFSDHHTICGDDTDWFSFTTTGTTTDPRGARVVVLTDATTHTVSVRVTDQAGADLALTGKLELPGLVAFDIPAVAEPKTYLLEVTGRDVSGPYEIELRELRSSCAGDTFDLYGDTGASDAPFVLYAYTDRARRACPGDRDVVRVPVENGDVVTSRMEVQQRSRLGLILDHGARQPRIGRINTTRTATAVAAGHTETSSTVWTLTASTSVVPSDGVSYSFTVERELGVRRMACGMETALGASDSTAVVDLSGAIDLGEASCNRSWMPPFSRDRIIRIDVPPGTEVLRASARPRGREIVSIAVLSECAGDASALQCDASPRPGLAAAVEHIPTSTIAPAPVYVMVSSDTSTAAIDVALELGAESNYTCTGADVLQDGVSVDVSNEAGTNSVSVPEDSTCGAPGSGAGPDRFFSVEVGAGERLVVELTGLPAGGFLWASPSCAGFDALCVAASDVRLDRAAIVDLDHREIEGRQRYFLAVDGLTAADVGEYHIRTVRNPDCVENDECASDRCNDFSCNIPNDRCDTAQRVTLVDGSALVSGTTRGAANDYAPVCRAAANEDVVYSVLVPAGARELRAEITDAEWDPVLAIRRGTCSATVAEVGCNDDAVRLLPLVVVSRPQPGLHYIIVDAYTGSGPFTMTVEVLR